MIVLRRLPRSLSLRKHIKGFLFDLIRGWFVPNQHEDINEDYLCGQCCEPVLRRWLFCSRECQDRFDRETSS